jgi:hypothetical protein
LKFEVVDHTLGETAARQASGKRLSPSKLSENRAFQWKFCNDEGAIHATSVLVDVRLAVALVRGLGGAAAGGDDGIYQL